MSRFMYFLNKGQGDSIEVMFDTYWEEKAMNWERRYEEGLVKLNKDRYKQIWIKDLWGEMKSFKFMAVEPKDSVWLYKVCFADSIRAIGIKINNKGMIGTFRPHDSLPFIDSLHENVEYLKNRK